MYKSEVLAMNAVIYASYFIMDEFGKELISIYCIVYPIIIGVIFSVFGYLVFRKKDLV
jgi:ABC-2 type transport system permease protein